MPLDCRRDKGFRKLKEKNHFNVWLVQGYECVNQVEFAMLAVIIQGHFKKLSVRGENFFFPIMFLFGENL